MRTLVRIFVAFWLGLVLVSGTARADQTDIMLELVNTERERNGLNALQPYEELYEAADVRARELPKRFSHTRPNGRSPFTVIESRGIPYAMVGENIAMGTRMDAYEAFEGWMDSDGHRKNMLSSDFDSIGIGYYKDRSGNAYWVQIFLKQSRGNADDGSDADGDADCNSGCHSGCDSGCDDDDGDENQSQGCR